MLTKKELLFKLGIFIFAILCGLQIGVLINKGVPLDSENIWQYSGAFGAFLFMIGSFIEWIAIKRKA